MKFKRKLFLIALAVFAVYLLVGCVGNPNPHTVMGQPGSESMLSEKRGPKLWWQKTTVGVPDAENPWLAFVRTNPERNEFDPWAYDNIQRYSVAPIATASPVYLAPKRIAPPTADEKIRNALKRNMRDFLREHRKKSTEVY